MRGFVRLPLGPVTLSLHLLVPVLAVGLWLARPDLGLGYLLLLGSVLAHEGGHATASLLLGGRTAEIRVWPIFALANVPRVPGRRQALVALAGKYTTVFSRHEVVVFPELGRLLSDIRTAARSFKSADGQGTPSNMYGEEEYYGIREYRPGDNPRRIHWRRSARTGQLIVREMSSSQAVQLWCVLNTWTRQDDNKTHHRLESAISCAATVICDLLERGVKVGLICNGDPLVVLPPAGGRGHRPRLLRELALRGKNVGDELTPHLKRLAWPSRWRGPCMLFGADETEDLRRAAQACNQLIGPASIYVPGTASFEKLFSDEGDRSAIPSGIESDDPMRLKPTVRSA